MAVDARRAASAAIAIEASVAANAARRFGAALFQGRRSAALRLLGLRLLARQRFSIVIDVMAGGFGGLRLALGEKAEHEDGHQQTAPPKRPLDRCPSQRRSGACGRYPRESGNGRSIAAWRGKRSGRLGLPRSAAHCLSI
jgi:hypothetical protein